MEVKVNFSQKRSKTISAKMVGDTMHINAPAGIAQERLQRVIDKFKKRFEKHKIKRELNKTPEILQEIAQRLNRQYFSGKLEINSIEYSANQDRIFGLCNHRTKNIKISYRLKEMPDWVRNYVIMHELAHIIEPNHGENFWNIVNKYSLSERARGYLLAKGLESNDSERDVED